MKHCVTTTTGVARHYVTAVLEIKLPYSSSFLYNSTQKTFFTISQQTNLLKNNQLKLQKNTTYQKIQTYRTIICAKFVRMYLNRKEESYKSEIKQYQNNIILRVREE